VILWRIAAETRKYPADDLSGGGAATSPGRWNNETQPVLYTAPTISLAVLETAAHIDNGGLPLNRFLVRIDVPDDVWKLREEIDVAALSPTWAAIPAGQGSARLGSDWLKALKSPILLVPSVIVPEERAALINPLHPLAKHITAKIERAFEYDRLFRA
jgi:RES domain-containing protein